MKYYFDPPRSTKVLDKESARLRSEQQKKNRDIFNRVGHYYIVNRLLEKGCFTGLGRTPYESVMIAPLEDSLSVISSENAMT